MKYDFALMIDCLSKHFPVNDYYLQVTRHNGKWSGRIAVGDWCDISGPNDYLWTGGGFHDLDEMFVQFWNWMMAIARALEYGIHKERWTPFIEDWEKVKP